MPTNFPALSEQEIAKRFRELEQRVQRLHGRLRLVQYTGPAPTGQMAPVFSPSELTRRLLELEGKVREIERSK